MSIVTKGVVAVFGFTIVVTLIGAMTHDDTAGKATAAPALAMSEAAPVAAPAVMEPETTPRDALYESKLVRSASAMSSLQGGKGDGVALMINLEGELCADVDEVELGKKPETYLITCTANRDGSGERRYLFDLRRKTITRKS